MTPAQVVITPKDTTITVGDRADFTFQVLDQDGQVIDPVPSWAEPVWFSEDPRIVYLRPDGNALALKFGETRVSASVAGLTAHAQVRSSPELVSLAVSRHYITQGVQNRNGDVPLIAGRRALLRIFVTGDVESYMRPEVVASVFRSNFLQRRFAPVRAAEVLPTEVDESVLEQSYNVDIPADLVQPGMELIIQVDPGGKLPDAVEGVRRVPETGKLAVTPVVVPPFDLTVVPVATQGHDASEVLAWTDGMTPEGEQVRPTRALLPIGEMSVSVHDLFVTSADLATASGWSQLLGEIAYLRAAEGASGYYYGALALGPGAPTRGLGFIGHPVAVGGADAQTLAHELGHNLGLQHAPCGGAISPDRSFPYEGGVIGAWGYDFHGARLLGPDLYRDLMGYCFPSWVSDYHFVRATEFRLEEEGVPASSGEAGGALLLWGRAGPGGLELDPAFLVDMRPTLPDRDGPYRLEGWGRTGERIFELSFAPRPVVAGEGVFVFAVPYDPAWEGRLEQVTLAGPQGLVTLDVPGAKPMAIVRDAGTGQVRAVLRDWDGRIPVVPGLDPARADLLVSDGLPGPPG